MGNYHESLQEEKSYLNNTLAFIRGQLEVETGALPESKRKLIASRKEMWEDTVHFSNDFTRLTEMNQHLSEINLQTINYRDNFRRVENYRRAMASPYFGRFDLVEEGIPSEEKIYVGLHNIIDPKTHDIYVYDWRAPISSIFYRYELGPAAYSAPMGEITGAVLLKRQYKIKDSELKYFFDSNLKITDEILGEILSRSSSPKMRNIVETIQKEQDLIIRDTDNELLLVQGVAGGGKTSIALHRVAFLLYDGLNLKIGSNNVIIISPNAVFSKYISSVLPELGEENVRQITFDQIADTALEGRFRAEAREMQLESLITQHSSPDSVRRRSVIFKGSKTFVTILNRLLWHYAHRRIAFEDVYYDGVVLESRQQLKNRFLNNKTNIPMAWQLKRIENMLLEKLHPLQKIRLQKIEKIVDRTDGHQLEVKSFSRLLSMKLAKAFLRRLHTFTKVDYWQLYKLLFNEPGLLLKLARGLKLPEDIESIISTTKESINKGNLYYEDTAPLMYLKLKVEGNPLFPEIRQVVIDEAQDYYPMQFEVFKLLFREAKYTVLGDFHQTVEKTADITLYDDISDILHKEKTVKLILNKGYRSTWEINSFTQGLLGIRQDFVSFERHGEKPVIVHKKTEELMAKAILADIARLIGQGYKSVAVLCKNQREAEAVHSKLTGPINIKLIKPQGGNIKEGVSVLPSYMAKGLEFDAVLVYGAGREKYSTDFDRNLLYIACTRALHRLALYYTGEKSPFI